MITITGKGYVTHYSDDNTDGFCIENHARIFGGKNIDGPSHK